MVGNEKNNINYEMARLALYSYAAHIKQMARLPAFALYCRRIVTFCACSITDATGA